MSGPIMNGAFADPRFRRLLAGQSLSTFGDTALYLTLGIWAKALTHSNAAAGGVFLALGIPTLFAPLFGHLADRVRRRPLLIGANALTGAMVLSLLAVNSRAQLWIIYLVAFCYRISFSVLSSGQSGLWKDMLAGDDLAAANAAMQSVSQGLRIAAPLAGAGLFVTFGGGAVAILDAVTFAAAIVALASVKVTESQPETVSRGSFRHDFAAGFRHIRAVPLLAQITLVTACAFSVIGLNETIIFAVIGQGLNRPPSFLGTYSSVQGAGAIAGGIASVWLLRRLGSARIIGLGLAAFALASAAYISHSLALCLAGAVADGVGLVWLVTAFGTAMQRFTPPRLQGRVNAAWTMLITTPQTVSIAAGMVLISFVDYRLLLLAVFAATGACALLLLVRPAPEPVIVPEPVPEPVAAPDPVSAPGASCPGPGIAVESAAEAVDPAAATAPR
jgi:MFS family permease